VWGGFTETERLRLLETGWEDTARMRGLVDVGRLEARLGQPSAVSVPPPRTPLPLAQVAAAGVSGSSR
jgi:WhiB family redox-sensing transcriptional regulator